MLRMGCCLWTVSILPGPPPLPPPKKNRPVTATSYLKENAFFCTCNSEHNDSTANTDSAVHISWHRKYWCLYMCELYVHLTVTKSLKAKSRTHFSSCSIHEWNVKGQIKHGHDLYASAVYQYTRKFVGYVNIPFYIFQDTSNRLQ